MQERDQRRSWPCLGAVSQIRAVGPRYQYMASPRPQGLATGRPAIILTSGVESSFPHGRGPMWYGMWYVIWYFSTIRPWRSLRRTRPSAQAVFAVRRTILRIVHTYIRTHACTYIRSLPMYHRYAKVHAARLSITVHTVQ